MAQAKFESLGHEYIKVRHLRRGLPGVLLNAEQVAKKYAFSESKARKKMRKQALREETG